MARSLSRAVRDWIEAVMRKSTWLACLVLVASSAWLARGACVTNPDVRVSGALRAPADLGLANFIVIHVDPAGNDVAVDWKGFHNLDGDAFHPPWQELTLTGAGEVYVVTYKGLGNNAVRVNGKVYEFDPGPFDYDTESECLSITFGRGISMGAGIPFQKSTRLSEAKF